MRASTARIPGAQQSEYTCLDNVVRELPSRLMTLKVDRIVRGLRSTAKEHLQYLQLLAELSAQV